MSMQVYDIMNQTFHDEQSADGFYLLLGQTSSHSFSIVVSK